MNLKFECPEKYPDDVTGVAWRNPDDVTTGPKIGKSTWPRLETIDRKGYTKLSFSVSTCVETSVQHTNQFPDISIYIYTVHI